mmetsp:Transcript_804/g.2735  ORF Transcript_804/g.2735 Transcript_804/m.2735 type:complete len:348 (-) Transcript_804:156-1199(-)
MSSSPPSLSPMASNPSSNTSNSATKSFVQHFKKLGPEKKSPPYSQYRSFIHEQVFVGQNIPEGLSVNLQKVFFQSNTSQASIHHESAIGFTPGMGVPPTAQHHIGMNYGSQEGQLSISTQLPHLSLWNYTLAFAPKNNRFSVNVHVQDAVMQGTPTRSIQGSCTYNGPDSTTSLDLKHEQNTQVKLAFMKQLTNELSAGTTLSYNQSRPRCTDLSGIAHYLDGDKKNPKRLCSIEHRFEDVPDTPEALSPSTQLSRLAFAHRLNANTYVASELTLRWSKMEAKMKYGLRQTWPAGGEMRIHVEDDMKMQASFNQEISQSVHVGLSAACSPSKDDYKFGVHVNIGDTL